MENKRVYDVKTLFHPESKFEGNVSEILKDYPQRSSHLEKIAKDKEKCKKLNSKFIKDGYMYLLRGAKIGQETGFYSKLYSDKKTIQTEDLNVDNVAYAHQLNGNTPFISATTSLSTASAFANNERIYILKIPVQDVYYFCEIDGLLEQEYLVPDFIKQEEIIRSFRHDKFKQIYNFLNNEIGLELTPEDLDETIDTINRPDKERIKTIIEFNEGSSQLDEFLVELQRDLIQKDRIDHSNVNDMQSNLSTSNTRQIAIITDVHALYEPLEAVLKDIKNRGIHEIYSLGDNIGTGPNPKEVMDLLEEYHVVSIAGNNEEYINLSTAPFNYFDYEKEASNAWTKSQLTKSQTEKLLLYPKFIELAIGGKKIALCHFANDIRCDYGIRSTWSYQRNPMNNYKQFFYTNSDEQLKEFAYDLGFPCSLSFEKENAIMKLEMLKEYVKRKRVPDYLKGIESYIKSPLFFSDDTLKTVNDYDAIIQGHVHFESHVETDKTSFHTLRAVGMGNIDGRDALAAYTIIHETKDGYKLEKVEVPFDKETTERVIKKTNFPKRMISRFLNV